MVYFLNVVLLSTVVIETAIIFCGKDVVKELFKKFMDEVSGMGQINFRYGLYATEAQDFIERIRKFFRTITLAEYVIDDGWIEITYIVNGVRVDDTESLKRAICIELHSYFQENRGINYWGYYIPVLTMDTVKIKIAASKIADKQYRELQFKENCKQKTPMEEENFNINKGREKCD